MNVKNEPVFQSELRVVKNGKVTEKERGEVKDDKCDHNDKG
ncbi:hypothetical protein [Sporosarcina sp. P17b]|nr:hypothetical protein [Sporosarcina sp. P17b]